MTCERPNMKDETLLIEVKVAVGLLAVTIIALTLMLGHTLWRSVAHKLTRNHKLISNHEDRIFQLSCH